MELGLSIRFISLCQSSTFDRQRKKFFGGFGIAVLKGVEDACDIAHANGSMEWTRFHGKNGSAGLRHGFVPHRFSNTPCRRSVPAPHGRLRSLFAGPRTWKPTFFPCSVISTGDSLAGETKRWWNSPGALELCPSGYVERTIRRFCPPASG